MKRLSETPTIHEGALVEECTLGPWTEVWTRTHLREVDMGAYSYIMMDCQAQWTTIGKFCSIASSVRLNAPNHPTWRASQHHSVYRAQAYGLGDDDQAFFEWRKQHWVTLGHDVWIGHGATVTPGVTVGTGAVIGAGAVVTKDVEPYTIVGGVPAKPLKRRFTESQADALQSIAWWDWPREAYAAALPDIRALSIDAFIEKYA